MNNTNQNIHWDWPALALETVGASFTVSGLITPYEVLCWYDREGGREQWQALNPTPEDRLPPPEYLFLMADVILATARRGDAGGAAAPTPTDAVIIFGRKRYEGLVASRLKRPEDLKVLVVPVDLDTDELHRLAAWVEFLRGHHDPETREVPPPWAWDRHAGARE